jgi:hypothetical protein
MESIAADITELGLFAKRADLLKRGHSIGELRSALSAGHIIRVRKGWYSLPTAPVAAVQAWRIGGRLTGLSALRSYGIWTPKTSKLHVTVPADARALRRPTDMHSRLAAHDGNRYRVTWTDEATNRRSPHVWRTSLVDTLVHIVNVHDRVTSIICLDAALHNRREGGIGIEESDLDEIFARAPQRARGWRDEVDGRAGSGGETEFRLAALASGIPFVPQPAVRGVGVLDGQIGLSTFVEIDGADVHDNEVAFEADRDRDIAVASRNGRVLRFSYKLFRKKWDVCEKAMRNALEDDYRRNGTTDFPAFPYRLPAKATPPRPLLRRIQRDPADFDADAYGRDRMSS